MLDSDPTVFCFMINVTNGGLIFAAKTVIFRGRKLAPNIGEIVLFHRKQSGLSRDQLAVLAGVGKTVIYDIEKRYFF